MEFAFSGCVMFVGDIARATAFYRDRLGQEILFDHGPCVAFKSGFSLWQSAAVAEVVFGGADSGPELAGHGFELYFEHADIEAAARAVGEAGAEFVHPLVEQPWKQRCFRFRDPDGHLVEVAEPMPVVIRRILAAGQTPEEIAALTSMPVEAVRAIAGI